MGGACCVAARDKDVIRNNRSSRGFGLYRVDPFAKKDWYDIKAPSVFSIRNVGKTLVTRTQGTKIRTIVKPGCPQEVLKAALSLMASVTKVFTAMSSGASNGFTSL